MKKILEKELSENSFFDKSYIASLIERSAMDKVSLSARSTESAGVRFCFAANFHDAKIIHIDSTEKYGKNCAVLRIDFKGSTTEFKKGYRKFDISFVNAELTGFPNRLRELHILTFDCAEESENIIIDMESEYFIGAQAHRRVCRIVCDGIDVSPLR